MTGRLPPESSLRPSIRAAAACIFFSVALAGCAAIVARSPLRLSSDTQISARVRAQFEQNAAFDPPNLISVQTHDGVVYLRGLVSTPYQIEEAGMLAARVPGAARVENLLAIDNAR
jgi:osmotically-inducible protein OsmY